jgi:hypothetical protein
MKNNNDNSQDNYQGNVKPNKFYDDIRLENKQVPLMPISMAE